MLRKREIEHGHFIRSIDLSDSGNLAYNKDVADNSVHIVLGDRVASYTEFYSVLDNLDIQNSDTRKRLEKQFDYYYSEIQSLMKDPVSYNLFVYPCKDSVGVPYNIYVTTLTEPHKEIGKYSLGVKHSVFTEGMHIIGGVEQYGDAFDKFIKPFKRFTSYDNVAEIRSNSSKKFNDTLNHILQANARKLDPLFKDYNQLGGNEAGDFVISNSQLCKFVKETTKEVNITGVDRRQIIDNRNTYRIIGGILGESVVVSPINQTHDVSPTE